MTNPSRVFDSRKFLHHCYKYGFLLRSSEEGLRLGPPAIRICDRLVHEFLLTSEIGWHAAGTRRVFLRGAKVEFPAATGDESSLAHLKNAAKFLESKDSPLLSSSSSNARNEHCAIVQGLRPDLDLPDSVSTFDRRPFPHLSVVRCFPPSAVTPRMPTHRRRRLRFYRKYAELPGGFSVRNDGIVYGTREKGVEAAADADGDGDDGEIEDEESLSVFRDLDDFVVERVQPLSIPSLPVSGEDDASHRLVEFRVDVERAALSFLLDAFRIWRRYRNFSLHFRLAPTKAIIAARREDLVDETVAAVVDWIRENMEKRKLDCRVVILRDDDESDGESESDVDDDDDDDDDTEERPTLKSLLRDNGIGVPFFISVDRNVKNNGIVRVYQRETRLAEEIHLQYLVDKLADYLNSS